MPSIITLKSPYPLARCRASSQPRSAPIRPLNMSKPQLLYFPVRGRGEPIKLALAAKGIEFEVLPVDFANMKADLASYPFGQAPRFVDDEVDMCQSNAICRHIGRKHGMYGSSRAEAAMIDQIMDGVEDLRVKYLKLIYQDELAEGPRTAYWDTHCDPTSAHARNGGAHFAYLSNLLKRNGGGQGFAVGSKISLADILLFDVVDLHLRLDFAEQFKQAYPELIGHHGRIAAVPGIRAYLESPLRLAKTNGNSLG